MSKYTEDSLVQQPTAEYLEQQLGWESVYAHNKEDFGPDSLLGRRSEREVVLIRALREKLKALNPDLPDTAYEDAVRQITATVASQSIVAANREKYAMIRDGVPVTFQNDKGEQVLSRLVVIDFKTPENNHFLCVRELWVKGDLYRRRADVIGFVNGLPLLFIECKNISGGIRAAFEKNYSDYRDTIPHLFHHNTVVMLGNGETAKIGSITSKFEHFHHWKRLAEKESGAVDMETLLKGVCDKQNFLDLVENFILFDDSLGEPKKIIARNHQFLGVNQAVEAVHNREARQRKLGVFWHTQGAGKSYSMVMLTRKVHRKLGSNFTFLVLTDRDDLDTQIYKTFAGCGIVPCRAASGEHLRQLLGQSQSHVFSLIQKFNKDVGLDRGYYTQRDDIIVISDEAHRTQYGELALNMRNALPNASYIGFTGTPLFKNDEITRRVFGEYVSTYDFQRAVEDKATVPLYYDARGDKLNLAGDNDLNKRIAEKLEELEIDDIDVEQRLEKELKRDYHVITAEKRLDQIARDFVEHYSKGWETGKAMLICIDKITCVRMYALIEKYWEKQIRTLESQWNQMSQRKQVSDEQEAVHLQRQIDWLRETRKAVVISEEQGEIDKFRKWDLDITPHRRLIKEGIDLPGSMRRLPQFRSMQRMELADAFKEEVHPFRIAIVCAMWLTGFDVPSLSTLYLDKPLKAHTLMQAIARANRIHEGKNNGLIVDYCGIFKNLRRALATFAIAHIGGGGEIAPARPVEELLDDLGKAITRVQAFLDERAAPLDDLKHKTGFERNAAIVTCKEAANENDETRKRFEILCREVFKKFKACINVRDVNKYRADYGAIDIIYKSLQRDREQVDISDIIRQIHQIVDNAIKTQPDRIGDESGPYDISRIDFEKLKREFEGSSGKKTTVQNLKNAIEQRLRRLLEQNPLRTNFQESYEKIVAEYNREKDRVTIEKTFEDLLALEQQLDNEEKRAVREGLDEESLAVFDLLRKEDLSATDIKRIKRVAVALLEKLNAVISEIDQWREKRATHADVKSTIGDFLFADETGLPGDAYTSDEVSRKADKVFMHIYRNYPTVPSPIYART